MRRKHLFVAAVGALVAATAFLGAVGPSAAVAESDEVATKISGTFLNPAPGIPIGGEAHADDPCSGDFEGVSSSFMTGDWTGVDVTTVKGTLDLCTGASHGTTGATFVGVAADGTYGKLVREGTFAIETSDDGITQTIHVSERIVGGTLGFAGSKGQVAFDGIFTQTGQGTGTYEGAWIRPASAAVAVR